MKQTTRPSPMDMSVDSFVLNLPIFLTQQQNPRVKLYTGNCSATNPLVNKTTENLNTGARVKPGGA